MSTAIRRSNGQVIVFDTAENVVRDLPNRVTNHPIETGSSITDHIVTEPRQITVTAVISDAAFRRREDDSFLLGPGRSSAITDALIEIREGREVFELETRDEIFSDMVFVDLQIPRDSTTGDAARIQFTVQQIDTVSRRFALIPAAIDDETTDKATDELATGKQSAVEQDQSALVQLFGSLVRSKEQIGSP